MIGVPIIESPRHNAIGSLLCNHPTGGREGLPTNLSKARIRSKSRDMNDWGDKIRKRIRFSTSSTETLAFPAQLAISKQVPVMVQNYQGGWHFVQLPKRHVCVSSCDLNLTLICKRN